MQHYAQNLNTDVHNTGVWSAFPVLDNGGILGTDLLAN